MSRPAGYFNLRLRSSRKTRVFCLRVIQPSGPNDATVDNCSWHAACLGIGRSSRSTELGQRVSRTTEDSVDGRAGGKPRTPCSPGHGGRRRADCRVQRIMNRSPPGRGGWIVDSHDAERDCRKSQIVSKAQGADRPGFGPIQQRLVRSVLGGLVVHLLLDRQRASAHPAASGAGDDGVRVVSLVALQCAHGSFLHLPDHHDGPPHPVARGQLRCLDDPHRADRPVRGKLLLLHDQG